MGLQIEAMEKDLNKRHAEQIFQFEKTLASITALAEDKKDKTIEKDNKIPKTTKAQLRRVSRFIDFIYNFALILLMKILIY